MEQNKVPLTEKAISDEPVPAGAATEDITVIPEDVVQVIETDPVTQYMPDVTMNNKLIGALQILKTNELLPQQIIADAQAQLYHALVRGIVNTTDIESEQFLILILKFIYENMEQMFVPKKIFRCINMVTLMSDNQRNEFQILLRILVDTADPKTRIMSAKAMNWVQIDANLTSSYAATLVERLKNFYRI